MAEPNLPDASPSWVKRLFGRYVAFSERHTGLLLVGFLLLAVGSAFTAMRLELHTDFSELLPADHPALDALHRIAGRQKSATNLVMLVHSPDREANHRFAEALRPETEKMIPHTFSEIQWKPNTEIPDYGEKWKWLYAPLADLEEAEDLLDRVLNKRGSPLYVELDGDAETDLRKLRKTLNDRVPKAAPGGPTNYFEEQDQKTKEWHLGIMMWRRSDGLATRGDHETLLAIKETVFKLDPSLAPKTTWQRILGYLGRDTSLPARFHPDLRVEYTGGIAQAIDEQNGIRDDLTIATAVVGSLVLLVLWLYFRRLGLIIVIGAPAVLGLFLALSLALVTLKNLNINTAFLISIILGNGINSPIIMLARFGEERRRSRPVGEALRIAMSETLLGTLAAMAAASVAYGSLLLTSFRGFSQFGLLGGAGMILVWLMTFLLVPPLVIFGERLRPNSLTPKESLLRAPFLFMGRLASERPGMLVFLSVAFIGVALPSIFRYSKDPLEWNVNNLRTESTASDRLWPRMESLGMANVGAGYIGNNAVLLVDKPEQADPVGNAMFDADQKKGPLHCLKAVHTLSSTLPEKQDDKIEILERVRRKIDRHKDLMTEDEAKEVNAWRPPDYLRKLTVADLPRQVREAFTENDGQVGRLVGFDADYATYSDWDIHNLIRIGHSLSVDALGQRWTAYSPAKIFAGMLEIIVADGPKVALAALIGVVLLILIVFGPRGALPVLVSLAVGVVWWTGMLGKLSLKINFMNFVAVPITLGVGADYAANIWAQLKNKAIVGHALAEVIADTGSAVALCSMTTIIGYSSLLMSHNRALRSFGLAADLGEMACLLAAVLTLPALIQLIRRRSRG